MFRNETDKRLSYLEEDMETLSSAVASLQSELVSNKVDNLFDKVRLWGHDHDLHDAVMQYAKVNEEVGEIAHEITRNNIQSDEFQDAIGDAMVTLIILADIAGYRAEDCLEMAYNEIAPRLGKTVNATFIKD